MLLSVLIPAYNEVHNIQNILNKIGEVNIPKEIIVVDDGSTDGTRELLNTLKSDTIKVIFHEKNQGKGGAIKTAIAHPGHRTDKLCCQHGERYSFHGGYCRCLQRSDSRTHYRTRIAFDVKQHHEQASVLGEGEKTIQC